MLVWGASGQHGRAGGQHGRANLLHGQSSGSRCDFGRADQSARGVLVSARAVLTGSTGVLALSTAIPESLSEERACRMACTGVPGSAQGVLTLSTAVPKASTGRAESGRGEGRAARSARACEQQHGACSS